MLNDDNSQLLIDQPPTETVHETEAVDHSVKTVAAPLGKPVSPDSRNTTKPHRNTGSLDSLGGGRLP